MSPKVCSYSCRYCQLGITNRCSIARNNYYEPETIVNEVRKHLEKIKETDKPDYLTFVTNGEPTLDINLGKSIEKLKQFNIPIAVITNASLLWNQYVRNNLSLADWVSIKVDTSSRSTWEVINCPMYLLNFERHINGILQFSCDFRGKLVTETMLVKGLNDSRDDLMQTSALIKQINPSIAYLSVPTRPPAFSSVERPEEKTINEAYQIYTEAGLNVELLLGFEGVNTGYTGNAIEDIVNICTVHPIREDTMEELLRKDHADPITLDLLLNGNYIRQVHYNGKSFYVRQFNG